LLQWTHIKSMLDYSNSLLLITKSRTFATLNGSCQYYRKGKGIVLVLLLIIDNL
jgi:hypothetical protein